MAALGAPWPAAVGVSGGSDSLALMFLLRDWANAARLPPPIVLCVDHGLRSESKAEAGRVVAWARKAGLKAYVLSEAGARPQADIEAAARALRYRLMGAFARKHRLNAIYVAHTQDDQAETFLLRLARGSGVDGLAAMRSLTSFPDASFRDIALVRPLLAFERHALRAHLEASGHPWIDDPMNADPRFARVRIRLAWDRLADLGLTPARLVEAARHLDRAREALDAVTGAVLARACRPYEGGFLLDRMALEAAPAELGLRALAAILMIVSGNPYRPRFDRLQALFAAVTGTTLGAGRTLHGCRISPVSKADRVFGSGTLAVLPEKSRRNPGKSQPQAKEVFKTREPY